MCALARWVNKFPPQVLEVGHYYGLSTAVIASVLATKENPRLVSFDAHIPDKHVSPAAPNTACLDNLADFGPWLELRHEFSQTITDPIEFPVFFYDGDHYEEQARLTDLVINSPAVKLFIFDDKDFGIPTECCKTLLKAGWRDYSPSAKRELGDKANPETMTLGIFVREE
jgi:hypothetical protein